MKLTSNSDNHQRLCFTLALWNGKDDILKERLFGLNGSQGNHGEDVKELYYYLDSTPTHSYMKYLYKYPQGKYPYQQLIEESQNRSREVAEFELMDTDLFDEDRYWDIFVEVSCVVDMRRRALIGSTQRTRTRQTPCRSVSLLTTVDPTRPICTSSLNSSSVTRGHGPRSCRRTCPACDRSPRA